MLGPGLYTGRNKKLGLREFLHPTFNTTWTGRPSSGERRGDELHLSAACAGVARTGAKLGLYSPSRAVGLIMLHVREETCGSQRKVASSNGVITARNTTHDSPSRLLAFCTVCGATVPSTVQSFHHRPSQPGEPGSKCCAAIQTVRIIV